MKAIPPLPLCRHRGRERNPGHFDCSSPKLIVAASGVPASTCRVCPYVNHEIDVDDRVGGGPDLRRVSIPLCVHLGGVVHPPDAPDNVRDWRQCSRGYGVVCACRQCQSCADFSSLQPELITRVPIGHHSGISDIPFNASLIEFEGRRVIAYRRGWSGGGIHLSILDRSYRVLYSHPLDTVSDWSSGGSEDPRLFVFRGQLHVSFSGVVYDQSGCRVSVLVASLTPDFRVERVWYPHYVHRTPVEKNWVFFEHQAELYCVYSTHPRHQILRVRDSARLAYSTPAASVWNGGLIRGGASPVLHRGQYYHWFHGWLQRGNYFTYSIGVVTFAAQPPFAVHRMTSAPVWGADQTSNPGDHHNSNKSIIFPAGAFFSGDRWFVSYGLHDAFMEVAEFDADDVEQLLHVVG